MSIEAMGWAWRQITGNSSLKSVLLALANYANEDWDAWPSQPRLARLTEMSERSIIRAIQELEKLGFITVTRRSTAGGRMTNFVHLNWDRPPQYANLSPQQSDTLSPPPNVTACPIRGDRVSPKPNIEPLKKESSLQSPKKGHRLPDAWKPDDVLLPFALSEGLTEQEFNRAVAEFCDHWHSVSGQKATKLDWTKTFRNRLRDVADRKRSRRSNGYSQPGWLERVDNAFAGIRRELSSDDGGEASEPVRARLPAPRPRG